MNKKLLTIILCVLIITASAYMFWSADKAQNKSDEILNEFERIDKDLQKSLDSIDKTDDSTLQDLENKLLNK